MMGRIKKNNLECNSYLHKVMECININTHTWPRENKLHLKRDKMCFKGIIYLHLEIRANHITLLHHYIKKNATTTTFISTFVGMYNAIL